MSTAPYLTSQEAYAVVRRLEKRDLLNANYWVQLMPASFAEIDCLCYVLRFFETEDAEQPIAVLEFLEGKQWGKSIAFIDQVQARMPWTWGEFKPVFLLMRQLPTLANTRRYKLKLLAEVG